MMIQDLYFYSDLYYTWEEIELGFIILTLELIIFNFFGVHRVLFDLKSVFFLSLCCLDDDLSFFFLTVITFHCF